MQDRLLNKARRVRLMIFDIDGVMTDGKLHFGPEGETLKVFHVLDGHGIRLLQQSGIPAAIISARQSPMVLKRAQDLEISHVQLGIRNKLDAFTALLDKTGLAASDCGYMGDDVIDLPVLLRAGFSASVPNGHQEVRSRVDYVTQAPGGNGAVREICDLILKAQGSYLPLLESYLK
ncbi:MAG: HAD hydrolase family protein [Oxalobacter formigenes]|nr:HAD hydrolase family protein [Oxalobacter formigenes]MCM1280838.1 HAD hydrolase family protein [Alistipes senegalensis]MCM1512167.1 HAD hydrolase family protein [Oxalobacter formigenes]